MPRQDSSVLMLVNVLHAIIILLLISFSDLPSFDMNKHPGVRGTGTRKRVSSYANVPGNWKNVLRYHDNKDSG